MSSREQRLTPERWEDALRWAVMNSTAYGPSDEDLAPLLAHEAALRGREQRLEAALYRLRSLFGSLAYAAPEAQGYWYGEIGRVIDAALGEQEVTPPEPMEYVGDDGRAAIFRPAAAPQGEPEPTEHGPYCALRSRREGDPLICTCGPQGEGNTDEPDKWEQAREAMRGMTWLDGSPLVEDSDE